MQVHPPRGVEQQRPRIFRAPFGVVSTTNRAFDDMKRLQAVFGIKNRGGQGCRCGEADGIGSAARSRFQNPLQIRVGKRRNTGAAQQDFARARLTALNWLDQAVSGNQRTARNTSSAICGTLSTSARLIAMDRWGPSCSNA